MSGKVNDYKILKTWVEDEDAYRVIGKVKYPGREAIIYTQIRMTDIDGVSYWHTKDTGFCRSSEEILRQNPGEKWTNLIRLWESLVFDLIIEGT